MGGGWGERREHTQMNSSGGSIKHLNFIIEMEEHAKSEYFMVQSHPYTEELYTTIYRFAFLSIFVIISLCDSTYTHLHPANKGTTIAIEIVTAVIVT